jgi:ubiquinone/menaquinone biosynthesis C-methylase UbiE
VRSHAIEQYLKEISKLLVDDPPRTILDLGCGNGTYTSELARACGATDVVGVDIHAPSLRLASQRGLDTLQHDLNRPLPLGDESFDTVISTQVIEHLNECDQFAAEIHRILKPGGYAIISTENLACWSNVISLVLGFQPHVESVSKIRRIGNPFAGNYGQTIEHSDMHHVNVFTYTSFLEFLKLHGFRIEESRCTGYPPAPDRLLGVLSKLDPIHSRYITIKARKPSDGEGK